MSFDGAPRDNLARLRRTRIALSIAIGVFVLVLVRTAWICDDAYINFRTIDNFLQGYGLRWNVAERVQTFTDPLWLFLVAASVAVTKEFYFTTIVLSLVLSIAAVGVYVRFIAADAATAVVGVLMLVCSKAFVDYSTGGLENPLAHFLIACFLALYGLWRDLTPPRVGWLALIVALCTLTRMDTVLLLAPALLTAALAVGLRRSLTPIVLGSAPLAAWELFSVVYYGQPLPNTAYAKLGGAVPRFERVEQGFYFLFDSINRDPLTLTIVAAALVAPFIVRTARDRAVALGMALTLIYVVTIGGDFMSGRFLAAPFLCGVVLLTGMSRRWARPLWVFPGSVILAAVAGSQAMALATDRTFHHDFQDRSGTVDERRVYYQYTGLLNAGATSAMEHPWARHGKEVAASGDRAVIWGANGFFGFAVGPRVHVIDPIALGDMLLARLPAEEWRPGHFIRRVPAGYLESISSGENRFVEPGIAALYERVRLIVAGPLLSKARLLAIWKLNTGAYADLIAYTSYGLQRVTLAEVATPLPEGSSTHRPGVRPIREGGIEVTLGRPVTTDRLEISVDANDDYLIFYNQNGRDLCHRLVRARSPHTDGSGGLAVHVLETPPCAAAADRIRIYGRHGFGPFFLGHVRLVS